MYIDAAHTKSEKNSWFKDLKYILLERMGRETYSLRVEEQCGQDAWAENIYRAKLAGDMEVAESVKIFVVCAQQGSKDRVAYESDCE